MPVAGKLRVAHLITDLDVGGAERMLVGLVTALAPAVDQTVVCMSGRGPLVAELTAAGVRVVMLDLRRGRASVAGVVGAWRALRRFRPQVLQTWLYHADLLGTVLAPFCGAPALCWNIRTADMDLAHYNPLTRYVRGALARLSGRPAAAVVNSEAGLAAHRALGYVPRAWHVIPNGFDTRRFRPDAEARRALRARLGLAPSMRLIGMIARLDPAKDHTTLLDALARLDRDDVHCLLIGAGVPRLAAAVAARGLAGRVHLDDVHPDIASVYPGLDLVVLSSAFGEAFPNVVGEAMACAVPCVVTDVGDARAIVDASGIVVPRRDPVALALALAEALAWPDAERTRRGELARKRIADCYAMDAVAARYESLYRELAATAR